MGRPETIRSGSYGKHALHLVHRDGRFFGLSDRKLMLEGVGPDEVWRRLPGEIGKADPRHFGHDGARARFLGFFPNGFGSAGFDGMERDYKHAAKAVLDRDAPLERALSATGLGEAVLKVFGATNIVSPIEKAKLRTLLRGPDADAFVQAAAGFAHDGDRAALRRLGAVLKPHAGLRWLAATYLPFLWRPDSHMLLKPLVTQDFAARVGHRFAQDYAATLDFDVYDLLLDLSRETRDHLADPGPRDGIDLQSCIWVVGSYHQGEGHVWP